MKNIKKIIAGSLVMISMIALNPIVANAAWKQDSTGWWYTEDSSYAKGWRFIDGNWYYFDVCNGYMITNRWVDGGYYVDNNGVWTKTSKYNMNQVMKDYTAIGEKSNTHYSISGDYMSYIGGYVNDEPCLFVMYGNANNTKEAFIGLDTLNVYDADTNNIIDTVKLL